MAQDRAGAELVGRAWSGHVYKANRQARVERRGRGGVHVLCTKRQKYHG